MKNKFETKTRIKTYIEGFDNLIAGGFPQGSNILISGGPGTGKTIFSLQYLYNGVKQDKEMGIYFSFEEKKESLLAQAIQFEWDFEKLEKSNKVRVISIGTDDISKNTITDLIEIIKSLKAKRVVIDSITTLSYITPESEGVGGVTEYSIKRFLYSFLAKLKEIEDVTTLIISQKDENISNTIAKYLCDGILNIEYESMGGDYSRTLTIPKMRKTKNDEDLHPLEINSQKGIVIHQL